MNDATNERTASCNCGGLSATVSGEPADVYACCCAACQRDTGSAFTYAALYPATAVAVNGEHKVWRRHGEAGRWIDNAFCPTCGGTVFFRMEAFPDTVGISVGCFADPGFARPDTVFWASRRHHWLTLPDGAEAMETQPG
jgi:hypothetical protein